MMGKIDPRFVGTRINGPGTAPAECREPLPPPSGAAKLAAARQRAWGFSPEITQVKDELTKAQKAKGSEAHWPALRAQVMGCLPKDERATRLGLALSDSMKLADEAASVGDSDKYQLAMRRLWTTFAFIEF